MTPYPMMDNYVQVNVGNAADSELALSARESDVTNQGTSEYGPSVEAPSSAQRSSKDSRVK